MTTDTKDNILTFTPSLYNTNNVRSRIVKEKLIRGSRIIASPRIEIFELFRTKITSITVEASSRVEVLRAVELSRLRVASLTEEVFKSADFPKAAEVSRPDRASRSEKGSRVEETSQAEEDYQS